MQIVQINYEIFKICLETLAHILHSSMQLKLIINIKN